jgi:hypothetical protein
LLLLTSTGALLVAAFTFIRGRAAYAFTILQRLAFCTTTYIAIVYLTTAFSKPVVLHLGDAECNDDWCLAVENVRRTPTVHSTQYEVTLRIFSRALRRPMRENGAADVYLVNSNWKRFDPFPVASDVPLNTLLQPGESVTAQRTFVLPADSHHVSLAIDRPAVLPVCVIIGQCEAFHRSPLIHLDEGVQGPHTPARRL